MTEWSEPAAKAAPGVGSGLALMFRPVKVFASLYAEIIKGQQQAWATMIGAARTSRELDRY